MNVDAMRDARAERSMADIADMAESVAPAVFFCHRESISGLKFLYRAG